MSIYCFHYRRNVPNGLKRVVRFLTDGKALDFGPAATKQWLAYFGSKPRKTLIPSTARIIEITAKDADLEKALFRWTYDDKEDVVVSVSLRNMFVIGAWKCTKRYSPRNLQRYSTTCEVPMDIVAGWKELVKGVDDATA